MKEPPPLVVIGGWGYEADALAALDRALSKAGPSQVISAGDLYRDGAGDGLEGFVAGLLDRLGSKTEPVRLAGWSLGGQIALATAVRRPEAVARLILIASTPRFLQGPGGPPGTPAADFRALRAGVRRDSKKALAAFRARAAAPGISHGTWAEPGTEILLRGLAALARADFVEEISRLPMPIDLLHGDADEVIPFSASLWMRDHVRSAGLTRVQGGGHDLPVSTPERVADFLVRKAGV